MIFTKRPNKLIKNVVVYIEIMLLYIVRNNKYILIIKNSLISFILLSYYIQVFKHQKTCHQFLYNLKRRCNNIHFRYFSWNADK